MSNLSVSTAPRLTAVAMRSGIAVLIVAVFITILVGPAGWAWMGRQIASAQLHAPRWDLIEDAGPAIKIHLATVAAALVLATVQMVGPKGRTFHRILGWTLALLLVTTAIASLFIRNRNGGLLNPFQLFAVWTLIAVPLGILAARAHNVRRHGAMMAGLYFGGMLFAGVLTFVPGRLMWQVFFG